MITAISVKNFTIINELELDLFSGMTVLTGETGAGKSIIIDTLDIALGGKADNSLIRYGKDSAEISIFFDIAQAENVKIWLEQNDLLSVDSNECIVRRILRQDGRSKIFVNDSGVSQQKAREFGEILVNIHGQHEAQNLLKSEKQLEMLDNFAENGVLLQKLRKNYFAWAFAKRQLDDLLSLANNHSDKLAFINYQLQELSDLALENDEVERLHQEHSYLSNASHLLANCNLALELTAHDDSGNVLHYLNAARDNLAQIKITDPKITSIINLLNNAIINAEEAAFELSSYINSVELNQDNLSNVEKRLNSIYDIARKHKIKPENLAEIQIKLQAEAEKLNSLDQRIKNAEEEIAKIKADYKELAHDLSVARKKGAEQLEKLITEKMQTLGMEGGQFAVNFSSFLQQSNNLKDEECIKLNGLEAIEFMVSSNPGMPLQPLRKIASGGELSRISLAIQVITMEKNKMPVLIFDEVDVGIGGKTAEIIGKLLQSLAAKTQVFCVTHLPQVAVCGKQHLKVEKITDGKTTEAIITNLSKKTRTEEIARMLGGVNISAKTLATAKEMLENVL